MGFITLTVRVSRTQKVFVPTKINQNLFKLGHLIYPAPRAESSRAVTGRRCPHSGVGEDFLERRPGSPHENGRNSGTKSRRLDPLVSKFA